MKKIQVLLYNEQYNELKQLAQTTGRNQSELVREAIDLLLQSKQQDWKQAAQQLKGIWEDHPDLTDKLVTLRKMKGSFTGLIGESQSIQTMKANFLVDKE